MATLGYSRMGDYREYALMTESWYNHLSPDMQAQDLDTQIVKTFIDNNSKILHGYYEAKNGRYYSYHFWMYSLFNVPSIFMFRLFGFEGFRSFYFTNSLLFFGALLLFFLIAKLTTSQKFLYTFLLVFSPALWFIHWIHPEVFSLSFIVIALAFMSRKKWAFSVLSAAIASTQNQQLLVFVFFLWFKGMLNSKSRFKDFMVLSICSIPGFFPFIFYWVNYGTTSLFISKGSLEISNISLWRVFELFFDLNIGLVSFLTISLVIFFCILLSDAIYRRKFTLNLQLFLVIIGTILISSSTINWNSGTAGPSRYAIWLLPLIFYILVMQTGLFKRTKLRRSYMFFLLIAIIIQGLIVISGGFFVCRISFIHHNPVARFVLNNYPQFYNPTYDIFCERTLNSEIYCLDPTIYKHEGRCKKAHLTCNGLSKLHSVCGTFPDKIIDICFEKGNTKKHFYVNY